MRTVLSYILLSGIVIACVVGIILASLADQKPTNRPPRISVPAALTPAELTHKQAVEQESIHVALTTAFPTLMTLYVFEREALFEQGQWYGAVLTYTGPDADNRDSLRVVLRKQDDTWSVVTTPPRIIVSHVEFPDIPQSVLKSINQPAPLPASSTSPAITPNL